MTLRSRFAKSRRLCLEHLESRANPSNFTVTVTGTTMTIVGDADPNHLLVEAVVGEPTMFQLSSTNGNSFNGDPGPFLTPTGIENITIKTLGGEDLVRFGNDETVAPITLTGNLSFDGGDDANTFSATDLTVGKSLKITNGANASGIDQVGVYDLIVGGAVTIKNGDGDTSIKIWGSEAGDSRIGQSLSVTNGAGFDSFDMSDMNISGNVTINQGKGNASGLAGHTYIYNYFNTASRSVIRGNVSVTYKDGNQDVGADGEFDSIEDTEITGNVTYNHGSGNFLTQFDGAATTFPVLIGGNLTVKGTGVNVVTVGTKALSTGLIVGGNFTSTSGGGKNTLNKLEVKGFASFTSNGGILGITGTDIVVGKNLTITRNTNANTILTNLRVGGALTITSKTGTATTLIDQRNTAGWNFIGGAVSISNGNGADFYRITDTNIGSHLTVNSGSGDGVAAGSFGFCNSFNTTLRSKIGGNVVVSFLDGNGVSGSVIYDAEVHGNVTFNNGSGVFESRFSDYLSGLPVLVHGGVSITGTGLNTVNIGGYGTNKGLIVDKTFKLRTGVLDDILSIRGLHVGGVATMDLGDGVNTLRVDDSTFNDKLTILTGNGADQIYLDTLPGTSGATTFKRPVFIRTGSGYDQLTRAGNTDDNQAIVVWDKFVFDGGTGFDYTGGVPSHEFYPFGNSIQEV